MSPGCIRGLVSRHRNFLTGMLFLLALFLTHSVNALNINVVDSNGTPVNGFRYLIEEDTTHPVTLGAKVSDSLSVGIHNSYSPPALDTNGNPATGHTASPILTVDLDVLKRYVVSILPDAGFAESDVANAPANCQ